MSALANYIKGLFTVSHFLLFLLLLAWLASRYQKRKLVVRLLCVAGIFLLLFTTPFLPRFLVKQLEDQYPVLDPVTLKNKPGKIYIHLLGSGYGLDKKLPATAQLATVAQGRLIEALRVYHQLDSSILVCSGASVMGFESQASVAKKAAILLGADSSRIITLDTPTTTQEEAEALKNRIGADAAVIIATDALHMPRAFKLFAKNGFHPIAAPTNFKATEAENDPGFKWTPALSNITVMDMVIHEYLGNLKAAL